MADSGEKKHDASPYRRQQAREKGQVARSQDMGSALVLLLAVLALRWWGPQIAQALGKLMKAGFTQTRYWQTDPRAASGLVAGSLLECLWVLLPVMLSVCGIVLVNNWLQVGFLFLPDKLTLDWKRIDPLAGTKRLFDLPNLARLGFGLLKIVLVATVITLGVWGRWESIMQAQTLTVGEVGLLMWDTTIDMCLRTAVVLLMLAALDYGFQWWKMEQDLKMTDEELREELRIMNGEPQIAARRRSVQRQLMMNRMRSDLPTADVVITNPTELAIAIKFDASTMPAPVLVAKGAGHVAARIRKLALESGVPIVERKLLAQAVFRNVEIGQAIPVEQYSAVADVLRYTYQLQGKPLPTLVA